MTDTDTKPAQAGTDLQALREVVRFLNGEAPLDGFWFGDHPPGKPYWWRKRLMQAWDTFEAAHREGRLVERGSLADGDDE